MVKISVIICSHNPRQVYLERVLDGLKKQTLGSDEWELLLIDNGSKLEISKGFDFTWHPMVRHVREEELGLTVARLRGIKEATAEILVFVDDDTILAANYLEKALRISEMWPFVGAWCGSAIPEYEIPLPDWVGDQVWRLTVVDVKEDVWSNLRDGFETMPYGAGMCIRSIVGKKYLERCAINNKHTSLDRLGKGLGGYGDLDMAYCSLDLGLGTGKSSKLRLTHLIPAGRISIDYFVRHAEGDAASRMLFRVLRGLPIQKPKNPSMIYSMRWFMHRLIKRVPREQYEIAKAHHRGAVKGWELAQDFLKMNSIDRQ